MERIGDSPILGHGRREFMRPPLARIMETEGELHGHPHNAYLEAMLDSGMIGLAAILSLYGSLLLEAIRSSASRSPEMRAAGGMALATISSLLMTGLSAQSFIPTVSMLTLWCTCGLMLRLRVEQRKRSHLHSRTFSSAYSADGQPILHGATLSFAN
jgi:O-antigen ligase